jgi:hypothetical protein
VASQAVEDHELKHGQFLASRFALIGAREVTGGFHMFRGFVLALILMRKRLLRYEGSKIEDDMELWRMVLATDRSEHRVANPRLTDEQIEGVSSQLSAILHGDMGEWATA